MPVASTVQTPELFKGCLKEYQLKGLQWLVNCYEQVLEQIKIISSLFYLFSLVLFFSPAFWVVNLNFLVIFQGLNGILADEMGLGKTIQAMVFLAHLAEVSYSNWCVCGSLRHYFNSSVLCRRKTYGGLFWLLHLLLY
jgi:DNA helicase INO80